MPGMIAAVPSGSACSCSIILFLNLEGMRIKTRDHVDRVRRAVEERVQEIGKNVALVVNYDDVTVDAAVAEPSSSSR